MSSADGLFFVWCLAGCFATMAVITGVRAVYTQWRAAANSGRQADTWTAIADAASRFCEGDDSAAKLLTRGLSHPNSQRIAIEALANLSRVDSRIGVRLRGQNAMVGHIRDWVMRELATTDPGRRAGAAEVVGSLRLRACRGPVALATNDEDGGVRIAACRALAIVDPDHAVGILLGLVERDGTWAADLLGDIVSRQSGEFSGSDAVLQRANEWAATPALLRLLANANVEGTERVMLTALDAEDDRVRANAAEALRDSEAPETIRAIVGLLGDSSENVRLNAVKAIGQSKSPQYALDLAAMLGDDSRLVRFAAGAALADIPNGLALLIRATEGVDAKAIEAAHLAMWQAEQSENRAALPKSTEFTTSTSETETAGPVALTVPTELILLTEPVELVTSLVTATESLVTASDPAGGHAELAGRTGPTETLLSKRRLAPRKPASPRKPTPAHNPSAPAAATTKLKASAVGTTTKLKTSAVGTTTKLKASAGSNNAKLKASPVGSTKLKASAGSNNGKLKAKPKAIAALSGAAPPAVPTSATPTRKPTTGPTAPTRQRTQPKTSKRKVACFPAQTITIAPVPERPSKLKKAAPQTVNPSSAPAQRPGERRRERRPAAAIVVSKTRLIATEAAPELVLTSSVAFGSVKVIAHRRPAKTIVRMTNGSAGTTIARKAKPPTRPTKASSMASEAVEQERFSPADTHKKKAKRAMAQASPSISEMKRLAPNPPGARRDVAAAVPATYAAKKRRTSNLQPAPVRGREDRKAVESPLQTLLATKTPMLPALLGLTQRETSPETSPVSESLNLVNPAWTFAAELPVPKSARGRWLRRLWNRLRLDGERGSLSAPTK